MTIAWRAVQAKRNCEVRASIEIVRSGYEAYLPFIQKQRHHNHRIETVTVPRFAQYLFARFDEDDPWGQLCRDEGKRAGIIKVICDAGNRPRKVPERAMEAMKAYEPPPIGVIQMPTIFKEGQPVTVWTNGHPQEAVFICYESNRAKVKLWFLGSERIVPVDTSRLESAHNILTNQASVVQ